MSKRSRLWLGGLVFAASLCLAADKPAVKPASEKIAIPKTTVEFTLVQIPAGKISLKDKEGKAKEFEIKSIWFGKTEVTWDEYDIFWLGLDLTEKERARIRSQPSRGVRDRPYKAYAPPDRGWGHEGFPACGVPCEWAKRYCEWLSEKAGKTYRLPTEAEWEYACRAGGGSIKPDKEQLAKSSWFEANSEDQTHHVQLKQPNEWGLYDMLGNVAEWVIRSDTSEAVAGGSFRDEAPDVHPAARALYDKSWQRDDPREPRDKSWYINGAHVGF